MTKEQIEAERVRFEKRFGWYFSYRLEPSTIENEFVYADSHTALVFTGWLAAKQDAQNKSRRATDGYCSYCGASHADEHLPNCKELT